MSLKEQIEKNIKEAMLSKKQAELLALRSIKSAILIAESEKGAGGQLNEDTELKLLAKAVKQRKDSAEVFEKQNRMDLAQKELLELEVISRYLPKQMSEDELKNEVSEIIDEMKASGPQDMGRVMGFASKKFAGKTDGKTLSTIVRTLLSQK